jgi:hypothetical protein
MDAVLLLAIVTALIHVAIMMLDIAGALAVWTGRLRSGHLPVWQQAYLTITFFKSLAYLTIPACPLTSLENYLRTHSEYASPYQGTFISHYAAWVPYQADATVTLLLLVSGCIAVVSVAVHQLTIQPVSPVSREIGFMPEDKP